MLSRLIRSDRLIKQVYLQIGQNKFLVDLPYINSQFFIVLGIVKFMTMIDTQIWTILHKLDGFFLPSNQFAWILNISITLPGENVWKFYRYAFIVLVQRKNDPPFVFGRKHVCIGKKTIYGRPGSKHQPIAIQQIVNRE